MPRLTASGVASTCSGRLVGDGGADASALVADSREVRPGVAFAAVRGGHAFAGEALQRGAPFVIVERDEAVPSGAAAVVVGDVVSALGALASEHRSRLDVATVGITGSVGKTLTKDFIAAALRTRMRVHATRSSYNTEVGVPLVVLSCPDDSEVLVCELGARHPGEIAELSAIVRPHVGVVTGIGVTHLAEFGSRAAIARTKAELLASLPADGVAVVPSDDDYLDLLAASTHARLCTVGSGGHVRYGARGIQASGRTDGWVSTPGGRTQVALPVAGRALVHNAAMAIAVASRFGVDPPQAAAGIERATTSDWRMQIEAVSGLVLVNDAWNANPTSVASALHTVRELAGEGEAWAVLGQMAELGPLHEASHERVGRLAAALGFTVVVVGDEADGIVRGAGARARRTAAPAEAADLVASEAGEGAWVLVKGSRVVGLYTSFPPELVSARRGVRR